VSVDTNTIVYNKKFVNKISYLSYLQDTLSRIPSLL